MTWRPDWLILSYRQRGFVLRKISIQRTKINPTLTHKLKVRPGELAQRSLKELLDLLNMLVEVHAVALLLLGLGQWIAVVVRVGVIGTASG
jgi:hypothetical protein